MNQPVKFSQEVTFGSQKLQISYMDGSCFPIPYEKVLGNGFKIKGVAWVCDPLEESYSDGTLYYLNAGLVDYHLDKNGAEAQGTIAGLARVKVRINPKKRCIEYMLCKFNGNILNPGYDCPNEWTVLVSW